MKNKLLHCILVAVVLSFPGIGFAEDALLYLSPPTAIVTIGEEFTIDVVIDTGGDPINAAEGAVTFDSDDVAFVSLATDGSIFSSWITPPTFDAAQNRIDFSGATGAQTYTGTNGKLFSVTLRALRNTASQIWFSQGAAVMAADGRASNVLSQLRSGTYTLTSREVVPALESVTRAPRADTSVVHSSTHPNQDGWAATTTALLYWNVGDEVGAVRTGVGSLPGGNPTRLYENPVSQVSIQDLEEGVSYFYVQFQGVDGWSDVEEYVLQSDVTPPSELTLEEVEREDDTNPQVSFQIQGFDELSGIAYYGISINGGKELQWKDEDETGIYSPQSSGPGQHSISVTAYDEAGNERTEQATFEVAALDTPLITSAPSLLLVGDLAEVRGSTYPHAMLEVFVRFNDGEVSVKEVQADANGNFAATVADPAREGTYTTYVRAKDERDAMSNNSETVTITVSQPKLLLFGSTAVSYLSVFTSLIGVIVMLGFFLWLIWFAIGKMRRRLRKETNEVATAVHESFDTIEDDVEEYVRYLNQERARRPLTRQEEQMLQELTQDIQSSEARINEELGDIHPASAVIQPIRIKRVR